MKTTIEVEIFEINIEDYGGYGYVDFDYIITVNGKKRKKENYSGSFSSQSGRKFRSILEKGYAIELALRDFTLEIPSN